MKKLREVIERDRITVLQEKNTTDGTVMKVIVPWIEANVENQNHRIYPKALLDREIKRLEPKIKEGALIGTGDHPASGMADIATASHIVKKLWLDEGGTGWAELAILPTERGKNIQTIIKSGGKLGISARGFGSVDKGSKKVMDDYKLMGIDIVTNPSFEKSQFSAEDIFESVDFSEEDEEEKNEERDQDINAELFSESELTEVLKSQFEKEVAKNSFFGSWEEWRLKHENKIRRELGFELNKELEEKERVYLFYQEAKSAGWSGSLEEFKEQFPEKAKKKLEEKVKKTEKNKRPYKPKDLYLVIAGVDPAEMAKRLNESQGLVVEEKKEQKPVREKINNLRKKYKPSIYDWQEDDDDEQKAKGHSWLALERRIAGEPRKK